MLPPAAPFDDDLTDEDLADEALPDEALGGEALLTAAIPAEAEGQRLDRALADLIPGLSRSRIQALLAEGRVLSGGRTIADASCRVKPGQVFEVEVPAAMPAEPVAQPMALDIVYEDAHLLVVNKPAGLVVHPAPGNPDRTLVNALLAHCAGSLSGIGGVRRPGIVHRLDKDTSGLMVVAKTDQAHAALSAQFGDRTISRTYQAVVWGTPVQKEGEVVGLIGRDPADRKRMAVVGRNGKHAHTLYRVVRRLGSAASLVECRLLTGRTHQIRVHLSALGHPIVGDALYARRRRGAARPAVTFPRQALHALALKFNHPASGEPVSFTTALPADMQELIERLERI